MTVTYQFRPTGVALADRILDGTAPEAARSAAARGVLPVPRDVLLTVLVHLQSDVGSPVAGSARETLARFTPDELTAALSSPDCDPFVLDHFARDPGLTGPPLVAVMANPGLSEDSIVEIARAGTPAAIDLLLLNQERLTRTPAAVDALLVNPGLTPDQHRRLLDFAEHFAQPEAAPAPERVVPLELDLLGPVSEAELRAMLGSLKDLPFINLEVGEFLEGSSVIEGIEELAELGGDFETVYQQILKMNPAQRLRAAFRGGREARQILIRDTNRIVGSAVLRNPRLTEDEVVSFSAQRSMSEDLLRQIGSSRAWMGAYTVVLNLVRNPKTPQAVAMNNIGRLNTKDLTQIYRDRNIPEVIRRMARKTTDARQSDPKKGR